MLAAMVSFSLAMTGVGEERCAALAQRALADDVLIGVDPGLFPVPALMVLTMADREEAVAEVGEAAGARAPPRLAARRHQREPVERPDAAVARRAARGPGAARGRERALRRVGAHALARDLRLRVPRRGPAAARRPRRRTGRARGRAGRRRRQRRLRAPGPHPRRAGAGGRRLRRRLGADAPARAARGR
jgi:hypothetical protein